VCRRALRVHVPPSVALLQTVFATPDALMDALLDGLHLAHVGHNALACLVAGTVSKRYWVISNGLLPRADDGPLEG